MKRYLLCIFLVVLVVPPPSAVAQDDPSMVTIDRLYASNEFSAASFGPARWVDEGAAYTTVEASEAVEGGQDLVRYDAETGEREILISADALVLEGSSEPLEIHDYDWSPDGSRALIFTNSERVWRDNTRGDYWVLDQSSRELIQLGGKEAEPSTLMFAKFSPDGRRVAYVREHNIYVEDVASGAVTPLTEDGSEDIINGTFDWVYEEEFQIQDGFRWSPDGEHIAYWQLDAAGVRDFLMINNTDSLYSYVIPVQYPKAGTTNSAARVGVVPTEGGETRWLDVPGDPRENYIPRMDWAERSDEIIIQRMNRLQNENRVMLGDIETGEMRTIHTEEEEAWLEVVDEFTWLDGGEELVWMSEASGWRHVYRLPRDGGELAPVTPGDFDVADVVEIDAEGGWLYYIASPEDPTERYLYRTRLDGSGAPERLTSEDMPGWHSYDVAPGGRYAFHTYSAFGSPPVISLVSLPEHETVRVLEDNAGLASRVEELERGEVEFFRVDAGEAELDGWMMLPPDFDPGEEYPVLFYVYGEPWSQTVVDRWGGHRYLWHLMLTQHGYIVASVDNRGTPSLRGRDWRKVVYGEIGVHASRDQAGAAREIAERPYIDEERIGVWGWSGGGSQTLNLLFRSPELYRMGISVAPVPDQRLYDTIYQERYMGLPQDNPEGYRRGSPITYADQLEGELLLIHGTGDDNVHYQGTERLINKLIEANKQFTMMPYPNRSHSISEGANTSRHLFTLMTDFLETNLPVSTDEPASNVLQEANR